MTSAYRALAQPLTPVLAGIVADFAQADACEQFPFCIEHQCAFHCRACEEEGVDRPERREMRPFCNLVKRLLPEEAMEWLEILADCNCNPTNHRCGAPFYYKCWNIRRMTYTLRYGNFHEAQNHSLDNLQQVAYSASTDRCAHTA